MPQNPKMEMKLMKRNICILLCALLLPLCVPARAEETAVHVSSREDMLLIAQNPAGSFELTDDIDMGGEPWIPIPFSGKLNGCGHTLYNLNVTGPGADTAVTYDGNRKEYETVFGGLFSVVSDAEIKDLHLVNAVIQAETDRHCFLGSIAGYARRSSITGCSVQTRNHLTLSSVNAGVGGLVGFSLESSFANCTVDAELVFTDINQDLLCEEFLGGVYSCGCGRIERCTVRTRGYAEVYGYAHSGGIIGMFKGVRGSRFKSIVSNTTADTEISFFEITPSRRAYCSPTIGEDSKRECARQKMKTVHYVSNESRTPARMAPEKCSEPQYTSAITSGTCTSWGYTTFTCKGCGYTYRDDYTPPVHKYTAAGTAAPSCTEPGEQTYRCTRCGHTMSEPVPATGHEYRETDTLPTCTEPGEKTFTCARCGDRYTESVPATGHVPGDWETVQASEVDQPGQEQCRCLICGTVLERRETEALPHIYAESVVLSARTLLLTAGDETRVSVSVIPEDVTDPGCSFTTSDETVAKVSSDGRILAEKPGTAIITCSSTDGRASAECTVTVSFTPWQWIRYYILFGWLR